MITLVEFPTIFEVDPVRTSNSTLGLQAFLWVHCMRWGLLWKLPKKHSSFYTYFSICWLPSAFHYESVVSLQFRKKPHPILLLLYFSSLSSTHPSNHPHCPPHTHTHTFQMPKSSYWPLHFPLPTYPGSLLMNTLSIGLLPCSRAVCTLIGTRNWFFTTNQGVSK